MDGPAQPDALHGFTHEIFRALELAGPQPEFTTPGALSSVYAVSDFAAASIGAAAAALAAFCHAAHPAQTLPRVTVDRRLASWWFALSIRPQGWSLPSPWDPIAGDYCASDGWIRLHTNAPHHRHAAEKVLGFAPGTGERAGVERAVAGWAKAELEAAVVNAGGCAAQMHSRAEWLAHPQGRAVAAEPLVHRQFTADARALSAGRTPRPAGPAERPLQGVRVLDLTRVLAGPVATRFLAAFGAQVLRIDPPGWDESAVVPEVTLGKRCARLDLREARGRKVFEELLAEADVLVHGYRPGALDALGFGREARRALAPGLVDVSLCAYGTTGPWAGRRGFDSLVQMTCGIAEAGMRAAGAGTRATGAGTPAIGAGTHATNAAKPVPLPVQALDMATGYLMAAAVLCGLAGRLRDGRGYEARLSLSRTAELLAQWPQRPGSGTAAFSAETPDDTAPEIETTAWGPARRLRPPVRIEGVPMRWDIPAGALGSAAPRW